MERSRRDLESIITSQKEELTRYETRLKDVVTAYKGLLKEKEALESSLSALTKGKDAEVELAKNDKKCLEETEQVKHQDTNASLQTQIITLMNSLATLSAEKSRMEASFQADKKQLRQQLKQKDNQIKEIQEKLKEHDERAKQESEIFKTKLIAERQEREKETNDHMVMIRELQKLYADERHLKENIEMQLNNFKTEFANSSFDDVNGSRLKELNVQLKDARNRIKQLELNNKQDGIQENSNSILRQVQSEMLQLKEQHAIAIKNEQNRAHMAEERSKKLAVIHEDRVANLEARLAELSSTVGNYDRLRHQDQESIQALKKKIQNLIQNGNQQTDTVLRQESKPSNQASPKPQLQDLFDEIMRLKKQLLEENSNSSNPVDISKIFQFGTDHLQCQQDLNRIKMQLDAKNAELCSLEEKMQTQKSHIATLQTKVKVLNCNIDEQDAELKQQAEKLRKAVKEERIKWKGIMEEMENDFRCKINEMEQQLQKQRVRSLQLLDEKENEIKTLQTSFEIFTSSNQQQQQYQQNALVSSTESANSSCNLSDEATADVSAHKTSTARSNEKKLSTIGDNNCHMLHYANEIARKDIEIANLRKLKYAAEASLRKVLQDKISAQEDLCDKIANLEDQVDRLERCKTREGANLEYLKNVIISYISTKDEDGKKHMVNAIGAVLQFTPTEMLAINNAFHHKK